MLSSARAPRAANARAGVRAPRARVVAAKAGKYDEELIKTAVRLAAIRLTLNRAARASGSRARCSRHPAPRGAAHGCPRASPPPPA